MKIAATFTACVQVGQETFRDVHTTRVFDGSVTFDQLDAWARSLGKNSNWQDLTFSAVDATPAPGSVPQGPNEPAAKEGV